ncbi:MAG TPA: ABC transporter permease [Gemmatimonadales bacterium]|jgi:predicted permease
MMDDLRLSVRGLFRTPGFSIAIIASIALGVAGMALVFALIDAVLLRPEPYHDANRLVVMASARNAKCDGKCVGTLDRSTLDDWRRSSTSFQSMALFRGRNFQLSARGRYEHLSGAVVESNLFPLLGLAPTRGRALTSLDDPVGAPLVAVLSDTIWRAVFGADPAAVGQQIVLNRQRYTVVGVMPRAFAFPTGAAIWTNGTGEISNDGTAFFGLGRLRPNMTVDRARTESRTLAPRWQSADRAAAGDSSATVLPVDYFDRHVGTSIWVLIGAVLATFLVMCANCATLVFVRAMAKRTEIAVRAALGASRWRLMRRSVVDAAVLIVLGVAIALALFTWARMPFQSLLAEQFKRAPELALGWRSALFLGVAGVCLLSVLGIFPGLVVSGANPGGLVARGGRGQTANRSERRVRHAMVVFEVVLAMVLLAGAAALVRIEVEAQTAGVGYDAKHLLVARVQSDDVTSLDPARVRFDVAQSALAASRLGEVAVTVWETRYPWLGGSGVFVDHRSEPIAQSAVPYNEYVVDDQFFHVTGLAILAGRGFSASDRSGTTPVAMINRAAAKAWFNGMPAIGRQVRMPDDSTRWLTIVGVVANSAPFHLTGLTSRLNGGNRADALMFVSSHQLDPARPLEQTQPPLTIGVRQLAGSHRDIAATLQRLLPGFASASVVHPLYDEFLAVPEFQDLRFKMISVAVLAVLCLALAIVGIAGVVSSDVRHREREIGIRLALGAMSSDIILAFTRVGAVLALVGSGLATALLLLFSRIWSTTLYGAGSGGDPLALFGHSAVDPMMIGLVATLFGVVIISTSWLSSLRVTRVDPVRAMRAE